MTVELLMRNAAPDGCERRLQSNTVADGTPLMLSEVMPMMSTVVSLKIPAVSLMLETVLVDF
jgi:hypothetical protein